MQSATVRAGMETGKLSIYGSLCFLAFCIAASIVASGVASLLVLIYVLAWAAFISPGVVRSFRRRRFWVFVLSLLVISTIAMGGEKDLTVAGLALSSEGLVMGVSMAVRAATIVIATTAFARTVSIGGLSALFARLGVAEIGFLLGIAANLLPLIQSMAASVFLAMRLRGGFRRRKLASLKRMVVTILVNSVRHSEEIVCAAEARAFGGVPTQPVPIEVMPADRWLFGLSAAMMVALVAV